MAIVLEVQRREIVETLLRRRSWRVGELLLAQRDAVDGRAEILGDGLGEAAPAAADLEHAMSRA